MSQTYEPTENDPTARRDGAEVGTLTLQERLANIRDRMEHPAGAESAAGPTPASPTIDNPEYDAPHR